MFVFPTALNMLYMVVSKSGSWPILSEYNHLDLLSQAYFDFPKKYFRICLHFQHPSFWSQEYCDKIVFTSACNVLFMVIFNDGAMIYLFWDHLSNLLSMSFLTRLSHIKRLRLSTQKSTYQLSVQKTVKASIGDQSTSFLL